MTQWCMLLWYGQYLNLMMYQLTKTINSQLLSSTFISAYMYNNNLLLVQLFEKHVLPFTQLCVSKALESHY